MTTTDKPPARKAPAYEVRQSPIHGNGVFARRAIAAGERIIEYKGERISWDDAIATATRRAGSTTPARPTARRLRTTAGCTSMPCATSSPAKN
jgi:hypothetical protein